MSITRLPSGNWRAQVYHEGRNVSVSKILGGPGTFATKKEAKAAREQARAKIGQTSNVTVGEFYETWTSDPLYARPKPSTNLHNAERVRAFCHAHSNVPLDQVDDMIVARWLAGGQRNGQVSALRAMFNDAASAKAGRLISRNPFAGLRISKTRGNRDKTPPTEEQVWAMIEHARRLTMPAYAAWLQVAAFTGIRPGELDALRWSAVDLDRGRIQIVEQFNSTTRTFTLPKNGKRREAPLTGPAREALIALPRESEWCFTTIRGTHFTPSSRAFHWQAVRAAAGWTGTLYLATRHFAGWYMTNVLELPSEDVAIALGHTDGGELVRTLYGHRDTDQALDRVAAAYASQGRVTPLRVVRQDTA